MLKLAETGWELIGKAAISIKDKRSSSQAFNPYKAVKGSHKQVAYSDCIPAKACILIEDVTGCLDKRGFLKDLHSHWDTAVTIHYFSCWHLDTYYK